MIKLNEFSFHESTLTRLLAQSCSQAELITFTLAFRNNYHTHIYVLAAAVA